MNFLQRVLRSLSKRSMILTHNYFSDISKINLKYSSFDDNILSVIFTKKIPALRRILIQNYNSEMRDEIIKIINHYIDEKEKSASEFINQKNIDNHDVLIYFSKINFLKFKILNTISIIIIHVTLFGDNENHKLSILLPNQYKKMEKSINIQDLIKRITSSINTYKFTFSVLNEYFNEYYADFLHIIGKNNNEDEDNLSKNGNERDNRLSEFLSHSVYLNNAEIMKFIDRFIIGNCDNFVIDDVILKVLKECFDIGDSEDIRSKFENNENEFLKFIQTEQDRKRLKRFHCDLGESNLNDKTLKTLPQNKRKLNDKKFFPKSPSESIIDHENQNKSSDSLSVDTRTNNITINNNSFFINNNSCNFKAKNDEFNFKNIKEKLIDRSFDKFKQSNNVLLHGTNDDNNNNKNIDLNRFNKIKNNIINSNPDHISSNLHKQNVTNNIESSNQFLSGDNLTNNSILTFEKEKHLQNTIMNSNLTFPFTKTDSDLNSIQNINQFDLNTNYNSNLSLLKKGNYSINSLNINSNNKSTNASNNTFNKDISYKNIISNDNKVKNIAKNPEKNNQIEIGFNKNNNLSSSEFINDVRLKNKINQDDNSNSREINFNLAKNKLRSGINAKLNFNVANIQKLKKEKSKKKSSKNKPEIINKLFEKLTERINKSDKSINYDYSINNKSKQLNQSSINIELINKTNNANDFIKDNMRQKAVDEYFEKLNQDNISNSNKKEEKMLQKHQLKNIINDNFYLKIKNNRTPENYDNPKFSKRKNVEDKSKQELASKSKENLNKNYYYFNETLLKDKYSEKNYDLLKIKNKNARSASEEQTRNINFIDRLKKNDNFVDDIRKLSKSPILSHNLHNKLGLSNQISNFNNNINIIATDTKEDNNLSSDDEVLAYSTPTKISINKNIRKASKDKNTLNNREKDNSGINLLNLFKQIKK